MGLKLMAEVGLDGSGFERGINRLGHAATHNLKNLVAGAFGVYGIHQAIHRTIESAEELVTASKRLDITIEQLQVLRQAAKENSVEFGKLETAFEKINVARDKALGGGEEGKKMMHSFSRLGVTQDDLKNLSAAQLFKGPMAAEAKNRSVEDMAGPLRAIFARGFGELIPILKTDFDELGTQMTKLGSIVSTEAAVKMKLLADEFDLLSNIVVRHLMPALVGLTEWLVRRLIEIKAGAAGFKQMAANLNEGRTGQKFSSFQAASIKMIYQALPENYLRKVWGDKTFDKVTEAILSGAKTAESESDSGQQSLDEKLKELVDRANKPPPKPDFDPPDKEDAEKKPKKHALSHEDALVRVGNFLGTSRNAISNLQERQVTLLQQIANNTKILHNRQGQFTGDASGIGWPIS